MLHTPSCSYRLLRDDFPQECQQFETRFHDSDSDSDSDLDEVEWFRSLYTCPSEAKDILKMDLEVQGRNRFFQRYRFGQLWFETRTLYAKKQRRSIFNRMVAFIGRSNNNNNNGRSSSFAQRLYGRGVRGILPNHRIIPPPIPTAYSSTGVPHYEYWYSDHFLLDDDTVTNQVPDRPFQMIPRDGGRWLPAVKYRPMGQQQEDNTTLPDSFVEFVDLPPVWDSFPGALGSNWYFLPMSERSHAGDRPAEESSTTSWGYYTPSPTGSSLTSSQDSAPGSSSPRYMYPNIANPNVWNRVEQLREAVTYIRRSSHHDTPIFVSWARQLLNDYLALASSLGHNVHIKHGKPGDWCYSETLRLLDSVPHLVDSVIQLYNIIRWTADNIGQSPSKKRKGLGKRSSSSGEEEAEEEDFCQPPMSALEDKDKDPMTPGVYLTCRNPAHNSRLFLGRYSQAELCNIMQLSPCPAAPTGYECVSEQVPTVNLTSDYYPSPVNCSHFTEVHLGFQLTGSQAAETMDTIKLQFGHHGLHTIAHSPVSMFHQWQKLNLTDMFGSNEVLVDDLRHMKLWAFKNSEPHDGFHLLGMKLRAKCPDSTTYKMDQFKLLNKWLERPSGQDEAMVWQGTIAPPEWQLPSVLDSCAEFHRLSVSFQPKYGIDGSQDLLRMNLGGYPNRDDVFQLLGNHRHGKEFEHWANIDIEAMFGRKTIAVRDITYVALIQDHRTNSENRWLTQGLKMRGQCVGSNKELGLDKFHRLQSQSQVEYLLPTLSTWTGDVNPSSDWRQLTTECTRIDKLKVHLGMGGNLGGGTSETLMIRFGRNTKNPPTEMVDEPYRDTWYNREVDLNKVFGTETVFVRDLDKFTVYSVKKPWQLTAKRMDMWMISSVFFTARCVDYPSRWIRNNQHMNVNEWFEALGKDNYARELVRPLSFEKWFWVDKAPKPEEKSGGLHEAGEF
ncbi:hypothetical protein L249_4954 [Ophiocordyceps polyrhachis-furcata BCC 54312]|uniref:Uncharacterized protein n=1 Tax=Ophiocordyceps polyrhachis-furcata BCC 54312 TaxID=1330021 RepID=A0A367L3P7_9HYPO|nr:hypothetical protein L249_4954 [Ophiocordyceps polyrhachis-furcata BCC 54312]